MTPDKLRAFSGVQLKYEVEMCHFTATVLPTGVRDFRLNNVLVE